MSVNRRLLISGFLLFFLVSLTWVGEKNPSQSSIEIDALFLGPKAENLEFMKDSSNFIFDEHAKSRQGFAPGDPPAISPASLSTPKFLSSNQGVLQVLAELSARLKEGTNP